MCVSESKSVANYECTHSPLPFPCPGRRVAASSMTN